MVDDDGGGRQQQRHQAITGAKHIVNQSRPCGTPAVRIVHKKKKKNERRKKQFERNRAGNNNIANGFLEILFMPFIRRPALRLC